MYVCTYVCKHVCNIPTYEHNLSHMETSTYENIYKQKTHMRTYKILPTHMYTYMQTQINTVTQKKCKHVYTPIHIAHK